MSQISNTTKSQVLTRHKPASQDIQNPSAPKQARYLQVAWILLLLLGAFYLFASLSDLAADIRTGLPADHLGAFHALTNISWNNAQQSEPQITQYVTLLEIIYAVHELVFGFLFFMIIAIPFRRRARWAWWTCWVPVCANITYSLTIAPYNTTTLIYSLIANVALPVLLLLHLPAFFSKR